MKLTVNKEKKKKRGEKRREKGKEGGERRREGTCPWFAVSFTSFRGRGMREKGGKKKRKRGMGGGNHCRHLFLEGGEMF